MKASWHIAGVRNFSYCVVTRMTIVTVARRSLVFPFVEGVRPAGRTCSPFSPLEIISTLLAGVFYGGIGLALLNS